MADGEVERRTRRGEPTVLGRGRDREERQGRALGAVVGFAIGDRLGSAVSEMSWPQIRQQFGDRGITSYAPTAEQLPSSLLRLALSLDAVIRADRARVAGDEPDLGQALAEAYELAAQRLPAFANDVIAESAAHYPIDPQFASSLALVDNRADEVVRYVPLALWTEVYSRLFQAARGAASTSADAEDASSIAAFVVMLQQCIFTHNPGRGLTTAERLLGELDDSELLALLSRAERIARHGITPEQIEQLGSGDTPAEAIAIAFCAATAASWDFDESLRIAVNHSGNSAVTGALCGALLGSSFDGVRGIPAHWAEGLTGGHMLHRLAQDACEQFGPEPRDDAEWQQRYPISPAGGTSPADAVPSATEDCGCDAPRGSSAEGVELKDSVGRGESGSTGEGKMSRATEPELTALEQAIERYAAEQGPIEDVYREFLVASLLLVTSPDSSQPAFFQVEGQPKEQIWVCTDKSAVPDLGMPELGAGTTTVNGYRLLPLLAERNVRILTQGELHDLQLIGSRAIEVSAPAVTDELRAEAARQPGTWLAVPDQMYRDEARENIPEHALIGAYWVDENGTLSARYQLNSEYRPSPATLGFPQPESPLEKVLHLWTTGYVSDRSMLLAVAQSEVALLAHEDGVPAAIPLGGKSALVAGSSPKYIPDSAKGKVRAAVAQMKRAFDDVDLVVDLGARHQAHIGGKALLRALEELPAEEPQPDPGGETGGTPANTSPATGSAQPQVQAQPQQPAPPAQPPNPHERFIGSMLGGAMGDALGFAIEFHDIGMIRRNHGDAGLTRPVLRDGVAQVSDDTQMMLFTLEGLIRAHVARRINPTDNDPVPEVQHAYQRWFHTQSQPWDRAGGPYAQHLQQPDGWLITHPELFSTRAPGSTCMSALAKFAQTHQHATPQFKINDSKGCGGVMRAAPVAVWSNDPAEVFFAAVGTAALTHSHPSGYLSAGVLAVIVHQLIRDVPLPESVRMARDLLLRWRRHEEQLKFLDAAVELAKKGAVSPEEIKDTLGQGWVGEEALAIGLYAALATDNLRDALLLSVNHSGDSDSTGIVCGNIAGALYGARAVPPEWLASLELRELVETLAKDALVEFSPGPPTDPGWTRRYPAW
ncbi:ADP-ribosylglycohydrolase [Saccharopolyspora shandongensis]|uniref:ADP-ribosylglycohydrolase n=1 Tax=Saccharopolyspora shandongensis TaxID=418495 RepID=A0A1H3C2V1_9PSEU|nr:type VII secretion system-associated protein [Saccharopolyspora shandongensis]SDX47829.1 ADP-ribosylglycohydrolase [Saccharopolyspora shandongensis]